MSRENVEIIRRMYREWNRGDMAALADVFDLEVEVRPALSAFLTSTVYRGHEGVAAWYAETYEPWAEMRAEPRRFLDAGERTVVVVGLRARVTGGHAEVDTDIAHVIHHSRRQDRAAGWLRGAGGCAGSHGARGVGVSQGIGRGLSELRDSGTLSAEELEAEKAPIMEKRGEAVANDTRTSSAAEIPP